MISFRAEVVGENSVATKLTSVQAFLRRRLVEGMRDALQVYTAGVSGSELSGGVLRSRTGKLRSSLVRRVFDGVTRIVGESHPKEKYGWMLGYGTPKNEILVRPFVRAHAEMDTYAVERKRSGARKGVAQMKPIQASSGIAFVRGHRRKMIKAKIPKPFMHPAYERLRSTIERRLRSSVEQAMAEANGAP